MIASFLHQDEIFFYRLLIKVLGCVIGRRRITLQPSPSGLAKTIIVKPIYRCLTALPAAVKTDRKRDADLIQPE